MQRLIIIIILFFVTFGVKAQEVEVIPDLLPYEDTETRLFKSIIVEIEGKTQKELVIQFKNWASTRFVNLSEVMVSETENQIVLNYITSSNRAYIKTMGIKSQMDYSWYVRMVVQFKDGKARAQFYDDGNSFRPGYYSQYGSAPATEARSIYISSFTNRPTDVRDLHRVTVKNPSGPFYDMHSEWQGKILDLATAFEKAMKDSSIVGKKDDF